MLFGLICCSALTKKGITKDLVASLEKDVEKLKRAEETLQRRKILMQPGGAAILAETEEDRKYIRKWDLYDKLEDEDAFRIHASEPRIQVFRHKPGQLDSHLNYDLKKVDR